MSTSEADDRSPTFSIELIRLILGLIALILPVLVWIVSPFLPLASISASYHTAARDIFVGLLFVLGAYLFAYKGNEVKEAWMANLAGLAAITAAVFPTSCDTCQSNIINDIHFYAGAVMFLVTAYFCLGPFRNAASAKSTTEAGRRVKFYTFCGGAIIACMVILAVAGFILNADIKRTLAVTFWGEFVMLWLFALAWLVAAKWLPWFTNKREDRLHLAEELEVDKLSLPKPAGK